MNKFSSVWVFSDTPSRLPELMSGAQAVGEKVNAFVLNEADSATACHFGRRSCLAAQRQTRRPHDRRLRCCDG